MNHLTRRIAETRQIGQARAEAGMFGDRVCRIRAGLAPSSLSTAACPRRRSSSESNHRGRFLLNDVSVHLLGPRLSGERKPRA